ncbi:hypothetical protein M404DRAFT_1000770 [Pisolithus tinctorius Marx 270]|uniref:Uncharacterized protein n=1 Tax=Pisolithus tinctorius Marx 270 TaxID=870435 RepID=A0A0C3NTT5_PISTI|nr:hypothetical protein M404DRAFT_1000770 [Pisolithus tinctorius Marx 270]
MGKSVSVDSTVFLYPYSDGLTSGSVPSCDQQVSVPENNCARPQIRKGIYYTLIMTTDFETEMGSAGLQLLSSDGHQGWQLWSRLT